METAHTVQIISAKPHLPFLSNHFFYVRTEKLVVCVVTTATQNLWIRSDTPEHIRKTKSTPVLGLHQPKATELGTCAGHEAARNIARVDLESLKDRFAAECLNVFIGNIRKENVLFARDAHLTIGVFVSNVRQSVEVISLQAAHRHTRTHLNGR
jgi:hypothetical protein